MAALTHHDNIVAKDLVDSLEFKEGNLDKKLDMLEQLNFKQTERMLGTKTDLVQTQAKRDLEILDYKMNKPAKPKLERVKREIQEMKERGMPS